MKTTCTLMCVVFVYVRSVLARCVRNTVNRLWGDAVMRKISYEVTCICKSSARRNALKNWLVCGHIVSVLQGGAISAHLVVLDEPTWGLEIRYVFPSRRAFDLYELNHAPALRTEGEQLFSDVIMARRVGEIVHEEISVGS